MNLTRKQIACMVELSAVKPDSSEDDIRNMTACALRHNVVAVFAMPSQTRLVKELIGGNPEIRLGGVIGFPSGAVTTETKVFEVRELLDIGCHDFDMTINIGMLRSGRKEFVSDDIRAVVNAANRVPVRVILENHYLTNDEIKTGCELCIKAGAAFVKTGTGWATTDVTPENITLIKSYVGDACGIKAAGGIRDLQTLLKLYELGATRFGISAKSAEKILNECGG